MTSRWWHPPTTNTLSVCYCLTDAILASREESEQPSMTNQDRGAAITVSSFPCVLHPFFCIAGEEAPLGSACTQTHSKHTKENLCFAFQHTQ